MLSKDFVIELNEKIKDYSDYVIVTEKGLDIKKEPSSVVINTLIFALGGLYVTNKGFAYDARQLIHDLHKYVDMQLKHIKKELDKLTELKTNLGIE